MIHGIHEHSHCTSPQHLPSRRTGSIAIQLSAQDTLTKVVYRTVVQRCLLIVLRPSTSRSREASVKVSSDMNTAHRTWVQPWPSVGLHALRNESGGGHGLFFFSSFATRGHKRQSGFWKYTVVSFVPRRCGRPTIEASKVSSFSQSSHVQSPTEAGSTTAPMEPACALK